MKTENIPYKIYLSESEMPQNWYNVRADMKNKPAPLVNPGTGKPMGFDDLRPVFCDELIEQELDNDTPYIPIPQEIRDFYKMYRPSPLVRAYCLRKARHPGEDLLQIRGQQHLRQPQAELCHRAGVLRQKAGTQGRYDRDGRRSVGHGPFHGLRVSGA